MPIETALETERRQDAEARFPSSDRSTGCAQGASGEMARATPGTLDIGSGLPVPIEGRWKLGLAMAGEQWIPKAVG